MSRFFKSSTLLVVIGILFSTAAFAGIGAEIYWAPTYTMATGSPAPTNNFNAAGGGLALLFPLGHFLSFDVGESYLSQTMFSGNTFNIWQTEADFQIHLGSVIYINAGAYYNYYATQPSVVNTGSKDYGLTPGIGFQLPGDRAQRLFIQVNYDYALNQQVYGGGNKNNFTPYALVGMIGLRFGGRNGGSR